MDDRTDRPRARLTVTGGPDGSPLVAALSGELDLVGVADVAEPLDALLRRPPRPLVLDVAELEFLDSSGVAVLVRIANRFDSVRTRSATEPVRRVIQVLGLADRLGLAADGS